MQKAGSLSYVDYWPILKSKQKKFSVFSPYFVLSYLSPVLRFCHFVDSGSLSVWGLEEDDGGGDGMATRSTPTAVEAADGGEDVEGEGLFMDGGGSACGGGQISLLPQPITDRPSARPLGRTHAPVGRSLKAEV